MGNNSSSAKSEPVPDNSDSTVTSVDEKAKLIQAQECVNHNTGPTGVNPYYYSVMNHDVYEALGMNGAEKHFNEWGKGEGRSPNPWYSYSYYRSRYPDLDAAFGNNIGAYWDHWVNNGIYEGRNASPIVMPPVYKSYYQDLSDAFGENWPEYLNHFINWGANEWRESSDEFSINTLAPMIEGDISNAAKVFYYMMYLYPNGVTAAPGASNASDTSNSQQSSVPDIVSLSNSDPIATANKLSEFRVSPLEVDPNYYCIKNRDVYEHPDVGFANAANHFYNWGINEGRSPNPWFVWTYYRAKYPDLDAAFGNNVAAYWNHWVNYGYNEGRGASPIFDGYYYRSAYGDLDNAFGDNMSEYINHFINWGSSINELRTANPDFVTADHMKPGLNDGLAAAYYYMIYEYDDSGPTTEDQKTEASIEETEKQRQAEIIAAQATHSSSESTDSVRKTIKAGEECKVADTSSYGTTISSLFSKDEKDNMNNDITTAPGYDSDLPFKNDNIDKAINGEASGYPYYDGSHTKMRRFSGLYQNNGKLEGDVEDSHQIVYAPCNPSDENGDNRGQYKMGLDFTDYTSTVTCNDYSSKRPHIIYRVGGIDWTANFSDDSHQWSSRLGDASSITDTSDNSDYSREFGCFCCTNTQPGEGKTVWNIGRVPRLRNELLVFSQLKTYDRRGYDINSVTSFKFGKKTVKGKTTRSNALNENDRYNITFSPGNNSSIRDWPKNNEKVYDLVKISISPKGQSAKTISFKNIDDIKTLASSGMTDSESVVFSRALGTSTGIAVRTVGNISYNDNGSKMIANLSSSSPSKPTNKSTNEFNINVSQITDLTIFDKNIQSPDFYDIIQNQQSNSIFINHLKSFITSDMNMNVDKIINQSYASDSYVSQYWQSMINKCFNESRIALVNFPSVNPTNLDLYKKFLIKQFNDACRYILDEDDENAKKSILHMLAPNTSTMYTESIASLFIPSLLDKIGKFDNSPNKSSFDVVGYVPNGTKFFVNSNGEINKNSFKTDEFENFSFSALPDKATALKYCCINTNGTGNNTCISNMITSNSYENLKKHITVTKSQTKSQPSIEFVQGSKCVENSEKDYQREISIDFTLPIYLNNATDNFVKIKDAYYSNGISNTITVNPCIYWDSKNSRWPKYNITNAAMAKCKYSWAYVDWVKVAGFLNRCYDRILKVLNELTSCTNVSFKQSIFTGNNVKGVKDIKYKIYTSDNDMLSIILDDMEKFGYSKFVTNSEKMLEDGVHLMIAKQQTVRIEGVSAGSRDYHTDKCWLGNCCDDYRTDKRCEIWLPDDKLYDTGKNASQMIQNLGNLPSNAEPPMRIIEGTGSLYSDRKSFTINGSFNYTMKFSGISDWTGREDDSLCPSTFVKDSYFFNDDLYAYWASLVTGDDVVEYILNELKVALYSNEKALVLGKLNQLFNPLVSSLETENVSYLNPQLGPACIYNDTSNILNYQYYAGDYVIDKTSNPALNRTTGNLNEIAKNHDYLDLITQAMCNDGVKFVGESNEDKAIMIRLPTTAMDVLRVPRISFDTWDTSQMSFPTRLDTSSNGRDSLVTVLAREGSNYVGLCEKDVTKSSNTAALADYKLSKDKVIVPELEIKYNSNLMSRTFSLKNKEMNVIYNSKKLQAVEIKGDKVEISYNDSIATNEDNWEIGKVNYDKVNINLNDPDAGIRTVYIK